jgi:hypothetical protein
MTTTNINIDFNITFNVAPDDTSILQTLKTITASHGIELSDAQKAVLQQFDGLHQREKGLRTRAERHTEFRGDQQAVEEAKGALKTADELYKSDVPTIDSINDAIQILGGKTLEKILERYKAVVEAKQDLVDLM